MLDRQLCGFAAPCSANRLINPLTRTAVTQQFDRPVTRLFSQRPLNYLAALTTTAEAFTPLSSNHQPPLRHQPACEEDMRNHSPNIVTLKQLAETSTDSQHSGEYGGAEASAAASDSESDSEWSIVTRSRWPSGRGFASLDSSFSSFGESSDQEGPAPKRRKHLSRTWDNFWVTHISPPANYARRHIVMAKAYKNCMIKMREHVDAATDQNLKRQLCQLYANCLNDYTQTQRYSETTDLTLLETDLFHVLHNLRFNIFLGDSSWNSAISDGATILNNGEQSTRSAIARANTHTELDAVIRNWLNNYVDFSKSFKIPAYANARAEIRDNIYAMVEPSSSKETRDEDTPLSDRKALFTALVISLYDSLTCDLSEAQHPALRHWQNRVLPQLHGAFMDLQTQPDLARYAQVLTQFLKIDQAGAKVLNIPLNDLDANNPVTESVAAFQEAISAPLVSDSGSDTMPMELDDP